ncbi:MAG: hypothetical protein ACK51N_07030 [bacterium]|jgi:hypothetical protein
MCDGVIERAGSEIPARRNFKGHACIIKSIHGSAAGQLGGGSNMLTFFGVHAHAHYQS